MLELLALVVGALLIAKEMEKMSREHAQQRQKTIDDLPHDVRSKVRSLEQAGKTHADVRETNRYIGPGIEVTTEDFQCVRIKKR